MVCLYDIFLHRTILSILSLIKTYSILFKYLLLTFFFLQICLPIGKSVFQSFPFVFFLSYSILHYSFYLSDVVIPFFFSLLLFLSRWYYPVTLHLSCYVIMCLAYRSLSLLVLHVMSEILSLF